jgi:AcrR family transcriptional regulator
MVSVMAGGRQLQFDKQQALKHAMSVFWQKGYVGASLSDLTEAMQINKPSLYAAFGNKEALFVAAVKYYLEAYASVHIELLEAENRPLAERLRAYLMSISGMVCDKANPGGCFLSVASTELASNDLPEKARAAIIETSAYTPNYLHTLFERELAQSDFRDELSPEQLTRLIITFMQGLAVMARNGVSQSQLEETIDNLVSALTKAD